MGLSMRAEPDRSYRLIDIRDGRDKSARFPVHQVVEPHNLHAITTEGDGIVSFPVVVRWWCTCGIYSDVKVSDGMLWEATHQQGWHRTNDPRFKGNPPIQRITKTPPPERKVLSKPRKALRGPESGSGAQTPKKTLKKPQNGQKRLRKG